jgi:hypothetical protein
MEHVIILTNHFVPVADERLVHLFYVQERALAILNDVAMAYMRISSEPNLIFSAELYNTLFSLHTLLIL